MTTRLAIQGGTPVRTEPWPTWPMHDEAEERAVLDALREGDWGGFPMPNTYAARFAAHFARRHDRQYALCVANGSVSLEIALQAMGVEPGAEVIVPAYTFEATASAALFSGCAPVFADIDPDTYCLSPEAVEAAITPKTQAIIPVHLAMRMADMDRLGEIARKHGLKILEDCAHAHGARWRGRGAGSLGDAGSFSFQTGKLMTAGEGGIVVTNDVRIMDYLYALTNCGRQRPGHAAEARVIGHNYRMTDIQAAILDCQLARLDRQHETRNKNAAILDETIGHIHGLSTLRRDERLTTQATYHYVFRYDAAAFGGLEREAFVAALQAEGVPCDGLFYEALYRSPLLQMDPKRYPAWVRRQTENDCPAATRAAYEEAVWMSHHLLLGSARDTAQIAEAIQKVCEHATGLIGFEHPLIQRQTLSRVKRAEMDAQGRQ